MIVPSEAPVPPPHVDMPENCIAEYNEARDIVSRSPRAAAALLRLCVQRLMIELGEKGKNINDDIGVLVKKGLPVEVQQALDYCRVVGNNGVHPGEIELTNNPQISHSLFEMLNFKYNKFKAFELSIIHNSIRILAKLIFNFPCPSVDPHV